MSDSETEGMPVSLEGLSATAVIESIPDPVVLVDRETRTLVAVNEEAGELFDCEAQALVGTWWQELAPVESRTRFENAFERALAGERIARHPSGGAVHVETFASERQPVELALQKIETGGDRLALVQIRNIQERIDRERQLRETTARLETLVTAAPVPVVILDTERVIERWNHAAEETFGWAAAEVVGDTYPLFPSDREADRLFGQLLDGQVVRGIETRHHARDGSLLDVELYGQPLEAEGEVDCLILSALDVTAMKQREQHLSVLHRVLRHNLRNKLNVIHASAEQLAGDQETQEDVERLRTATAELITLGEQAQQIERELRGATEDPTPATLESLLSDLETQLRTDYPAVDITIPADGDTADAFVPALARTILEAIVEYTIEHNDRSNPTVELDVDVGTRVTVTVSEDGPGLTEGDRTLIEEGEESELLHGSGLALARVHILVTELGGQISITDREPRGTSIRVELPRLSENSMRL
jgi:PAS domain S-box-containing protein